jgi:hypothetical protein
MDVATGSFGAWASVRTDVTGVPERFLAEFKRCSGDVCDDEATKARETVPSARCGSRLAAWSARPALWAAGLPFETIGRVWRRSRRPRRAN